ncbi:hypothetical protein CR513_46341, partial [Mucuna pruriens]
MSVLLIYLYVDDLIFTSNNPNLFEDFKKAIYTKKVLEKFKIFYYNFVNTTMEFDSGEKKIPFCSSVL